MDDIVDPVEQWTEEVKALDDNPNVFEDYCGECAKVLPGLVAEPGFADGPDKRCACAAPTRIFVGATPCDGDAWGAAGTLLDLVQRASAIITAQRAQIDQDEARSVRDEEMICHLRDKIYELETEIKAYRKDRF